MRVGILTFHDAINPGAFLQAYATQTLLRSLGHEGIIINYTLPAQRFPQLRILLRQPSAATHVPVWVWRRNVFAVTKRRYLIRTRRLKSDRELQSIHFDAVVVGADVVWDYSTPEFNGGSVYFGKGLNTEKLVAFAPSSGNVDLRSPVPPFVKEGLPRFHAIGVRDAKTQQLVEQICHYRPPLLPDPIFTLNTARLPEQRHYKPDYLLVYAPADTVSVESRTQLLQFAERRKLKLVSLMARHSWCDQNDCLLNPFEWVARIRCAPYFFTTTFHGTAFALALGKQFVAQYSSNSYDKTKTMLEQLNVTGRIAQSPAAIPRILECPWGVDETHARINIMVIRAKDYLQRSLNANEGTK